MLAGARVSDTLSKIGRTGSGPRSSDVLGVRERALRAHVIERRVFREERAMPNEGKAKKPMREQRRDLNGFDYNAPAELFPSRTKRGNGQVKYRRFETAAEALQFAIEEMPPPVLLGAFLEVKDERFGAKEMQSLYVSAAYPLRRGETES